MANNDIEKRLWSAADQLWANTGLKPSEFSTPVLGLIFLRYAEKRFQETERKFAEDGLDPAEVEKHDFQAEGVLYLPEKARFSYLNRLAEGENLGKAINEAMAAIEAENEELKGVLPRSYAKLENAILTELLRLLAPIEIEGDAFGKVYEYFLGEFAKREGQKGGVFYTPTSLVKLIVEIIEPFHGRIFDPACGSGGMFVQSAAFVQRHHKSATSEITLFGMEKANETVKLAKMNLAVHGLSCDIREANSYYEDPHKSLGRFDFVMANPPFNVSGVDKERLKGDRRFPLGTPTPDNANYLWIQLFYSSLNDTGRAGFVMHNSATDSDFEIRRKLVEEQVVDVIILTCSNLFYTVSLPCTLFFLDRGKRQTPRSKEILFIDARNFFEPVTTAIRRLTDEQIDHLASIVRQFRSEAGCPTYKDIPGLCRIVSLDEIREKGYSLNPKLYVEYIASTVDQYDSIYLADKTEDWLQESEILINSLEDSLSHKLPSDRSLILSVAKYIFARLASRAVLKRVPIRELLTSYIGGTWGKEKPDDEHSIAVRVIRGTDIQLATFGQLSSCPVRYIKQSQLKSRKLVDGDIIIEVSGGGKEQTTGRNVLITKTLLESSLEPLVCASFCKLLRINHSLISPVQIYFFIQQIYDHGLMGKYEVQSTGIKNFQTEKFLNDLDIPIMAQDQYDKFNDFAQRALRLIHLLGRIVDAGEFLTMTSMQYELSINKGLAGLSLFSNSTD